jgi:GT2 family glycosyltransferase
VAGPSLSVSILNYQRRDGLRRCLESVIVQDHPAFEVIVVDNASTDGSGSMVEAEFPQVRLLSLPRNVGCGGRNAGVGAARGEIVVTIDNDVLLEEEDCLRRVERLFTERPDLVCANFRILDAEGRLSRRDWCHPRPPEAAEEVFETDYVLEGACAFRRAAFLAAGGYWEPLFLGHEGLDLALRLLDAGGELLYWPQVSVRHLVSSEARPSTRIYYTFTRNSVWVAVRNHRFLPALRAIGGDLALMTVSSVRAGQWRTFTKGLHDAIAGWSGATGTRRTLRRTTYRRLRHIRARRPGLIAKIARHWKERPI